MYIPFSGPYWEDEGADHLDAIPYAQRNEVIALFVTRTKIWAGASLSEDEQTLWDQCLFEFPGCPIFKRMEATPEILNALDECAEGAMAFFEDLGEETEVDVEKGEFGLMEFTRHPKPLDAMEANKPKGMI